jgi:hypothetical protein
MLPNVHKQTWIMARPSNQSAERASMLGGTVGCADETACWAEFIDLDQRKVRLLVALLLESDTKGHVGVPRPSASKRPILTTKPIDP